MSPWHQFAVTHWHGLGDGTGWGPCEFWARVLREPGPCIDTRLWAERKHADLEHTWVCSAHSPRECRGPAASSRAAAVKASLCPWHPLERELCPSSLSLIITLYGRISLIPTGQAGFPLLGAPKCFILPLFYCNCFWNYLSWLWDLVGQGEGLLGPSFVPRPKRGPRTQGLLNKSAWNNLYCFPRQGKMEMTWVHYMKATNGAYTFSHCLNSSKSGVQDSCFYSFRP